MPIASASPARLVLAAATLVAAGCAGRAPAPSTTPASAPVAQGAAVPGGAMAMPATPGTAPAMAASMDHAQHHDHGGGLPPVTLPANSIVTEADVRFMQGMIAHHAQAVYMTRLAETAGAGARVLKLARKIDLSQAGEITLMQQWLREYGQFVPDTSSWRTMRMHGMLTDDELARLAAARGTAFDRQFLTLMIRHHEGAIRMVADLQATPRAGQEVDISVLANDVENTQTAEIGLMKEMLAELR
jgi:uncharacterized protein (DUF305 family)